MDPLRSKRTTVSRLMVALSAILYVVSLTRNTFCVPSGCNGWPGWGVLLMGWIEPVALAEVGPFVALSWYANPCVGAAWVFAFNSNRRWAVTFAGAGLLLGLAFLLGKVVLVSEGGFPYQITGHAAGYWLWIASLTVALGAGVVCPAPDGTAQANEPIGVA
jgi:hypothetical protein